jgi:hypothetical protein
MAEFKTLDGAAFKAAGVCGRFAFATPLAVAALYDRRSGRVKVTLNTGIEFAFDPRLAPGLEQAAADDLVGVSVEGVGSTLRFPRLDADFTVSRRLEGFVGLMD